MSAVTLKALVDVVEESYEFCLAYAARGVTPQMARAGDTQVRRQLQQLADALPQLSDAFLNLAGERDESRREDYRRFIEVLRRDAESARAAVDLVLAQPGITSQMVDNLNGMIHVRALLTDVFLVDEMLRPDAPQAPHVQPEPAPGVPADVPPPPDRSTEPQQT
ncbi:MAG: hypothetical protein F4W89_15235 [Acidobacteria bacterium]|nr:hypothetical protein [Acidobacteriota bacterium]